MDDHRRDARELVAVEAEQQEARLGGDEQAHLVVERATAGRLPSGLAHEPHDEVMQRVSLGPVELAPLGETERGDACQSSGIVHSATANARRRHSPSPMHTSLPWPASLHNHTAMCHVPTRRSESRIRFGAGAAAASPAASGEVISTSGTPGSSATRVVLRNIATRW